MKKIFRFLSVILGGILLTVSCGGSTGDLMGLPDILPTTSTKVLKKVNVAETGTTAYDVNYLYTVGKLTAVSTSNSSFSYTLQYNGSQISKITRTETQTGQPQTVTFDLSYSGTQLTQVTGAVSEAGAVSATYKTDLIYAGTKPSQVKTTFFLPGTTLETEKITSDLQFVGNNISKWILSTEVYGGPVVIPPMVITTDLSNYDTNPNPYRTLPSAFTLATFNFDTEGAGPAGLSSNNYRMVTVTSSSGSQTENVVHTYDTGGYPTKASTPSVVLNFEYLSI